MQYKRKYELTDEIQQVVTAYESAVLNILEGKNPNNMSEKEFRIVKDLACEAALSGHSYLRQCYLSRIKMFSQDGNKGASSPQSEDEKTGASILAYFGNIIAKIKYQFPQSDKKEVIRSEPKYISIREVYDQLCRDYQNIPSDEILAKAMSCSKTNFSNVRHTLREEGFVFTRLKDGFSIKKPGTPVPQDTFLVFDESPVMPESHNETCTDEWVTYKNEDDLYLFISPNGFIELADVLSLIGNPYSVILMYKKNMIGIKPANESDHGKYEVKINSKGAPYISCISFLNHCHIEVMVKTKFPCKHENGIIIVPI